jgi:hypothetical protein
MTSVVLVLCLIAFQVQALARVSLPCDHEAELSGGCPMHGGAVQLDPKSGAADSVDQEVLDCVKCALVLALGSLQVWPAPESVPPTRSGGDQIAPRSDHFYRFFPEPPARPPQDHLA